MLQYCAYCVASSYCRFHAFAVDASCILSAAKYRLMWGPGNTNTALFHIRRAFMNNVLFNILCYVSDSWVKWSQASELSDLFDL